MKLHSKLIIFMAFFATHCKHKESSETAANLYLENTWQTNEINICWDQSTLPYSKYYATLEQHILSEVPKYVNVKINSNWPSCPIDAVKIKEYVKITQQDLNQHSRDQFGKLASLTGGQATLGAAIKGSEKGIQIDFKSAEEYYATYNKDIKFGLKHTLTHELFHGLGAHHEHERADVKFADLCPKTKSESTASAWYSLKNVMIGKADINSIVNYCTENETLLSPIDAFAMGLIFGYPKSDTFKQKINSLAMNEIIRVVPTQFPIKFNDQERSKLIYGPKGDLMLWIQMWLSLDPRINLAKPTMYLDLETQKAIQTYRQINGLPPVFASNEIDQALWQHMYKNYGWRVNPLVQSDFNQDALLSENVPLSLDEINLNDQGSMLGANGAPFVVDFIPDSGMFRQRYNNLPKDTKVIIETYFDNISFRLLTSQIVSDIDLQNGMNGHWYVVNGLTGASNNGRYTYKAIDKNMRVLATARIYDGFTQYPTVGTKIAPPTPNTDVASGSTGVASTSNSTFEQIPMPVNFQLMSRFSTVLDGTNFYKFQFVNLPSSVTHIDLFIGTFPFLTIQRSELMLGHMNALETNYGYGFNVNDSVNFKFFSGTKIIGTKSTVIGQ